VEWHGGTLKQPERRVIGLQQRKIGTEARVLVNRYSLSQYPKFDGPEGPPGSAQQLQEKFQLKALHLRNNPLLQHPELSRKMNLCQGIEMVFREGDWSHHRDTNWRIFCNYPNESTKLIKPQGTFIAIIFYAHILRIRTGDFL